MKIYSRTPYLGLNDGNMVTSLTILYLYLFPVLFLVRCLSLVFVSPITHVQGQVLPSVKHCQQQRLTVIFTPPRLPRRLSAQTHNKMAVLRVLYVTAASVDLGPCVTALRMQLHRKNDVRLTAQYTNIRPEYSYRRHGMFRVPKD
jgi:hypothetical protein